MIIITPVSKTTIQVKPNTLRQVKNPLYFLDIIVETRFKDNIGNVSTVNIVTQRFTNINSISDLSIDTEYIDFLDLRKEFSDGEMYTVILESEGIID